MASARTSDRVRWWPTAARPRALTPGAEWLRRFWPLLLLSAYLVAGFGPFVGADFASSDWWSSVATNHLQNLADIPRLLTEPMASRDPDFIRIVALNYRPVGTASFAIDYRLWGLDHPWGYQLTNLVLHGLVVLATYCLAVALGLPRWAGVLAAVVFTSHPAIVATVPAIGRRFDTLSAALGLASVLLVLRGGTRNLAVAAVLFIASVLAKETTLLLVPLTAAMLAIRRAPIRRVLWLLPPVALTIGMRLAVLGSLGGYGTAEAPSADRFSDYREAMVHLLEGFAVVGPPVGSYVEMTARLGVLVLGVIVAAWLCPPTERAVALLGLAWFLLYAEAYAFLRVYNGWYLYQPLIGIGLLVGGLAAGGVKRWPSRRAVPALALSIAGLAVALHSSTFVTAYPEWLDVGSRTRAYLAAVDACTEDGDPPLVPKAKGPYADVVEATGLADYSVRAYLELKYPNGRPCASGSSGA